MAAYPPGRRRRSAGLFLFDALAISSSDRPSAVNGQMGRGDAKQGADARALEHTGGGGGGGVKVTSAPCSDLEENNVAGPSAVEETLSPDLPRCNRDCNARQCMASAGAVATDRHRPLPSGVEGARC